jgi:hypothetical protein
MGEAAPESLIPAYAPELNPDEYLNSNLKQKVHSGLPARTAKDLRKKAISFMRMLVKRPQHAGCINRLRQSFVV